MNNQVFFTIPAGMSEESVAKTFAAYVQGANIFDNKINPDGTNSHGPYRHTKDVRPYWQLDRANNFFLEVVGDKARLFCRHDTVYKETLATMLQLFTVRVIHQEPDAVAA